MTLAAFAIIYAVAFVVVLLLMVALCKASKGREDEWH